VAARLTDAQKAEARRRRVQGATLSELARSYNGTGIAPEIQDKLFQPFVTTKLTGEGTGLDLSIGLGHRHPTACWARLRSTPGSASSLNSQFDCRALTGRQSRRRQHECLHSDWLDEISRASAIAEPSVASGPC
jgi:hypothetical protein